MARNLEWIDVVGELLKQTLKSELKWKVGEPLHSIGKESDERIESVFYTTYQGKKLRLYERTRHPWMANKAYRYRHEITGVPIHDPYPS